VDLAGQKWPDIVRETIIGALNTQMIGAQDEIVSIYHRWGVPASLAWLFHGALPVSFGDIALSMVTALPVIMHADEKLSILVTLDAT
jgi:hypothetical protein